MILASNADFTITAYKIDQAQLLKFIPNTKIISSFPRGSLWKEGLHESEKVIRQNAYHIHNTAKTGYV